MKAPALLLLISLAAAEAQFQWISDSGRFIKDAALGSWDMARAYLDMREANLKTEGTDKYFHARGNYDAAQRGPGGAWAAKVISDTRELGQLAGSSGRGWQDMVEDQRANEWGRSGKDPNALRPPGLPDKY